MIMVRDRTTVKLQPGLLLQPFILSQLVGAVLARVVEGSDVTPSEYAVTSTVAILGSVLSIYKWVKRPKSKASSSGHGPNLRGIETGI